MRQDHLFDYTLTHSNSQDIIEQIPLWLSENRFHHITTLNPQIIMEAQKNDDLHQFIQDSTLIIPDSVGIKIANKLINNSPTTTIAGVRLTQELIACERFSIYLVGATQAVLDTLVTKIRTDAPNTQIKGQHHGFFQDPAPIIADIQKTRPDIVFAALGCPKQEAFLKAVSQATDYGVGIGVGGSFDVLSGSKDRAPDWMIQSGTEWLYRGATEPKRMLKWGFLPKFVWHTLTTFSTKRKKQS